MGTAMRVSPIELGQAGQNGARSLGFFVTNGDFPENRTAGSPALLNGTEYWTSNKSREERMHVWKAAYQKNKARNKYVKDSKGGGTH